MDSGSSSLYENSDEEELHSLIDVLKQRIKDKDSKVRKIKNPKLLLSALDELNCMVGMKRLKNSIALQVMRLIEDLNLGCSNLSMLNTIIYGPPGVGKSRVGVILARIWHGLGYLQEPKVRQEFSHEASPTQTPNVNYGIIAFIAIIFLIYLLGASTINHVYTNWGIYWLIGIVMFMIIVVLISYWMTSEQNSPKTGISNVLSPNNITTTTTSDDIISVVSRQDFVAGYVGQTATKTKVLLTRNLGKVLFVDEAYSLLNDSRDSFGHEALTAINLFMSEHPGEIVLVFAGYKDKMKNGIFRAQPGLPRRCMWHFECDGYSGDELCEIFMRQATRDGWRLSDEYEICDIIRKSTDIFKSYGGDTERLLFFSKLQASKNNFLTNSSNSSKEGCTLTPHDISTGIQQLLQNNITSEQYDTSNVSNMDKTDLTKVLERALNKDLSY